MTAFIHTTQLSTSIIDSSFPQISFFKLNLSQIPLTTTRTPSILVDVPTSISPSTSPILSTSPSPHITLTSPPSIFPPLDIPSIPTTSSPEIATPLPTSITLSHAPIIPYPPIIISPLSVEVHISQSQPDPSITVQDGTILNTEEMVYFGEDAVVSLGKYFGVGKRNL